MRSSKKRSRSSQNRPRTLGNIINRVFDSSGPEGKVRGTPQQIIEKYQQLARDAQLSNDRVAAENFQQHAEHYTRMLAEAQREMAAEQEARQAQFQQNGQNGNGNGQQNGNREYRDRDGQRDGQREPWRERDDRGNRDGGNRDGGRDFRDPGTEDQPMAAEVIDLDAQSGEGHLIETPETRSFEPRRRDEAPRDGNQPRRDGNRDGGQPRREGNFRRDRDDRNRDQAKPAAQPAAQPAAAAPVQPELPSFITGPVVEPKPKAPRAPKPAAAAEASGAEASAEAPAEKPRRAPRKPKAEAAE